MLAEWAHAVYMGGQSILLQLATQGTGGEVREGRYGRYRNHDLYFSAS